MTVRRQAEIQTRRAQSLQQLLFSTSRSPGGLGCSAGILVGRRLSRRFCRRERRSCSHRWSTSIYLRERSGGNSLRTCVTSDSDIVLRGMTASLRLVLLPSVCCNWFLIRKNQGRSIGGSVSLGSAHTRRGVA